MINKLKIILSMLIFGSIGIFVRNIKLSSLEIAFLRAVIASIVLLFAEIFFTDRNLLKMRKNNLYLLIFSGAAMGFNWICLFQSYKYTTISNATLSYYFAPVFVILSAPYILKEKLSIVKIAYSGIAMLGLFLVVGGQTSSSGYGYRHIIGILYGLLGASLYASVIIMNKFIKHLSGFDATIIQLVSAVFALLPFVIYNNNLHITKLDKTSLFFAIILGIFHTGFAYFLYFSALKELKAQSVAILSYIDPISAVMFASIFLGENMNMLQVIGGTLILGSALLCEKSS